MSEWGVTEAGYRVLEETWLGKRIDEDWDKINRGLIFHPPFAEDEEIKEVLRNKKLHPARKGAVENWLKESKEKRWEDLLVVSGSLTDAVLDKEEIRTLINNSPEIGGLEGLDGLVAAYCMEKHRDELHGRKVYIWRSNGFKTKIYGSTDGDLQIHQVQTKPQKIKIKQKSLDENDNEPLFGKLKQNHIDASYDYWPHLAAITLKYADTVGMEIPEAKDWRGLMESYDWNGDIKEVSNWGVGYEGFPFDYENMALAQMPDKTSTRSVGKMFFGRMQPNASRDVHYVPVIDASENLMLCKNYGSEGGIELNIYGKPEKYYAAVCIPKQDVSHMFKGAVQGIMTHQSRTNPEFLAHMLWQYEQIREGKTAREIMEEGSRFGTL